MTENYNNISHNYPLTTKNVNDSNDNKRIAHFDETSNQNKGVHEVKRSRSYNILNNKGNGNIETKPYYQNLEIENKYNNKIPNIDPLSPNLNTYNKGKFDVGNYQNKGDYKNNEDFFNGDYGNQNPLAHSASANDLIREINRINYGRKSVLINEISDQQKRNNVNEYKHGLDLQVK